MLYIGILLKLEQNITSDNLVILHNFSRKYWFKIISLVDFKLGKRHVQLAFTCSKLTIGTLEQGVKYVHS